MALMSSQPRSTNCEPRWATPRTPGRETLGPRMVEISRKLGREPMPWQEEWFYVVGELVEDPETGLLVPAYPEAFATVPRQQGKTTIAEAWMWDRLILWEAWDDKPQAVVWTAQNGSEARKKFRNEVVPSWKRSKLWRHVDRPRFMADDTGMSMKNGSVLSISNTAASSGHGSVVDAILLDEIFADTDNRREQAFVPAMATRHDRQKMVISTAGDETSVLYNRKQSRGRASVAGGANTGVAYLEYSADPSDPGYDPESPETWRRCMPALGYTITERMVRQAFVEMLADPESGGVAEFERAWLNVPKSRGGAAIFGSDVWNAVLTNTPPSGALKLAVDAHPELSTASIAAASESGIAEVLMHNDGTGWLLDELTKAHKSTGAPVVVDTTGPVGGLASQLEARGVKVVKFSARDTAHACAETYTRISDRKVGVRPNHCDHCNSIPITTAVEAAVQQPVGDGWKWSRKTSAADVSPLMALSLAVGAVAGIGSGAKVAPFALFGS